MNKITELKQKRAQLVDKQRNLIDTADEEERDLSSEEEQKFERIQDDIEDLEGRIKKRQKVLDNQKKEVAKEIDDSKQTPDNQDNDYRDAFESYIRYGKKDMDRDKASLLREYRAQNVANNVKGGYLVVPEWENQIIDKLEKQSVMRQIATVESTSSETNIPISTSKPSAGWIDEEGSYPESDEEFGPKSVDAWKEGMIIKISEELLYDNDYNLEGRIERDATIAFDELEEPAFIDGDNVKKPRGFIQDADVGETASATDSLDSDEILNLLYSLKRGYRNNARWLMNDNTALALRKLTDGQSNYLWQPGYQQGEPDRLLGYPVSYSDYMPDIGTSNKPIAFGDFAYYTIYDREGMFMQRLVEKYADNGQVGFRTYKRTDGILTLDEAIKVMQMSS